MWKNEMGLRLRIGNGMIRKRRKRIENGRKLNDSANEWNNKEREARRSITEFFGQNFSHQPIGTSSISVSPLPSIFSYLNYYISFSQKY